MLGGQRRESLQLANRQPQVATGDQGRTRYFEKMDTVSFLLVFQGDYLQYVRTTLVA